MKKGLTLTSAALAAALLSGCGGGGSGTPDGGSGTGAVNSFGPIETRGQVNGNPIVRDLGKISTVALAGILTEATYRPQGKQDNETAIVVGNAGSLDVMLETGETLETWHPNTGEANTLYAYPVWSPDGTRLYFRGLNSIFYTTPANPDVTTTVVSLASGLQFFTLSPSGNKIAYTRTPAGESDAEIFVRDVAGGPTKRLTTNDDSDFNGVWIDEDNLMMRSSAGATNTLSVINVNNLSTVTYAPAASASLAIGRNQDGTLFVNTGTDDLTAGFDITQKYSTQYLYKSYLTPEFGNLGGASISPGGDRWVMASQNAGVYTTELIPNEPHLLTKARPIIPGCTWQPALGVTKFVGSSSKLGSTSAGIIATRRTGAGRNGLSSFVSWDCETRSTSTISDDVSEVGSGAKTYVIEADRLTALKYANRPFFNGLNTVNASGTSNGAVVTVDGTTGVVTSVVTLQETRGAKAAVRREGGLKVIEGKIQGVWNAKGKNLAPSGASKVTIDDEGEPTVG